MASTGTVQTEGYLVIIGTTDREDGQPEDLNSIPLTTPMFVGYMSPNETVNELLLELQPGNPKRLVCYAAGRGSYQDVLSIQEALMPEHIRGSWFMVWPPLVKVIQALRG